MITVWELGVDTTPVMQGHHIYSNTMRPPVFEFENVSTIMKNNDFDIVVSSKPKGLIHTSDFSKPGYPGKQEYGHGVDVKSKHFVYSRVLLIPLSPEMYLLVCRKKNGE